MSGKKIGLGARVAGQPEKKEPKKGPAKESPKGPPEVPLGKPSRRVPPRGPPSHAKLRMFKGTYKITAGNRVIEQKEVPTRVMNIKEKKIA